jgi:hypothetical protein
MVKRYVPAWRPIDDPTWFDLQSDSEQHLGVSRHGYEQRRLGPTSSGPFARGGRDRARRAPNWQRSATLWKLTPTA